MTFDSGARANAQATWNARACEEIDGDKNIVEYFDLVARNRYEQHPWMRGYYEYDSYPNKKVLEIGIGQGTDLASFGLGGAICNGVDITDNHLQLTARNFALRGLEVSLNKADATKLPFPDNHFDCVYSMGVMHHIPEIDIVLKEISRVLKPHGRLSIAVYHKWSAFHIFQKILADGLRNGWLFTKGYDGLLATIEAGADGVERKPYVKLYSRMSLKRLMLGFAIDDLSIHQLNSNHFWPSFLQKWSSPYISSLESRIGWYVTLKARAQK